MQRSRPKSGRSEMRWLVVQYGRPRLSGCTLNHRWWDVLYYSTCHLSALAVTGYPFRFGNRKIVWWDILLLYQLLIRWSMVCKSLGLGTFQLKKVSVLNL